MYHNLSRGRRGEVVFSEANGRISQIGLVEAAAVTAIGCRSWSRADG